MNDLASQIKQMQRPGGMGGAMGMLPGMSKCKGKMAEALIQALGPIQEHRARLAQDLDTVDDILHDGSRRARTVAEETMDEVRQAMAMWPTHTRQEVASN